MTLPEAARGQPAVRVIKSKGWNWPPGLWRRWPCRWKEKKGNTKKWQSDSVSPLLQSPRAAFKAWLTAVYLPGPDTSISLPQIPNPISAAPPRQACLLARVSVTEHPRPRLCIRPVITVPDRHFVLLNSLSVWLILQRLACKSSCQHRVSWITYLWGNW